MATAPKDDILPIIRMTLKFHRPFQEVWDNFLDPILMLQWLGSEIHADIKEGGMVRFMGDYAPTNAEIENHWDIKRITENAILFSWGIMGVETLFIVRFTEWSGGTTLEVNHGAVPVSAKNLNLTEHWNLLLANFKSVVELGEPALRFDYTKYHPLRMTRYDPKDVRLSVLCRAPPSLPFDVWTNPEKLGRFIRAEQPKVDRQYAGIYTWWAEGQGPVLFTKMEPDKELEFSWVYGDELETRVNVRFEEAEGNTLVVIHHYDFQTQEATVGYDIGWASMLSELKLVCELGESGIERLSEFGGPMDEFID